MNEAQTAAIKKINEIVAISRENKDSTVGYLAAAVGWLLKDRIDQLVKEAEAKQ